MITSVHNEQVKKIVSLQSVKGRKEYGEYIIEGKRLVQEAFLRKAKIKKLFYVLDNSPLSSASQGTITLDPVKNEHHSLETLLALAKYHQIETEEVSDIVMNKISATEQPQGILAVMEKKTYNWNDIMIQDNTILLILDGIQDPGNVGTILRTALAADVKQIILTRGTADIYNPKVIRSSMGAIFSQIVLTDRSAQEIVDFCQRNQCALTVSSMEGKSIFESQFCNVNPVALVIGNEAFGPDPYFLNQALRKYSIPMSNNVESLNAAMAAGIFLYEMRRQVQFLKNSQ